MRKIIVAAATAGLLAVAGPAFAGPHGTSDSENSSNNVSCGGNATAGPVENIQVNTAGGPEGGAVVICNDSDTAPIQGRVIASGSTTGGGWVAADGDKDNPDQGKGWARVDFGTAAPKVRCGGPEGGWNSETPNLGNQAYCG